MPEGALLSCEEIVKRVLQDGLIRNPEIEKILNRAADSRAEVEKHLRGLVENACFDIKVSYVLSPNKEELIELSEAGYTPHFGNGFRRVPQPS